MESTGGAPIPREQSTLLTNNFRTTDPHIKYTEQQSRGYGILEARPGELLVEFKGVDAMTKGAPARSLGRFRVASGSQRVEVLSRASSAA